MKTVKIILATLAITLIAEYCYSQSNDKKTYTGGELTMILADKETNEPRSVKPMGKNVTIIYDTYFKSYWVKFEDEQGRTITNTYSYVSDRKDGWMQYQDDAGTYYIYDLLDDKDQNLQVEFVESPVDWAETYFIYSFD